MTAGPTPEPVPGRFGRFGGRYVPEALIPALRCCGTAPYPVVLRCVYRVPEALLADGTRYAEEIGTGRMYPGGGEEEF